MASGSAEDICRVCFQGQSYGSLVQPCLCRGSIGFAHKPCMERWVSERREEECSICHYNYPIRREARTVCELLRHPEGRREPLLYALLGFLFSLSLVHVFALAWLLGVRAPLPWGYRALNGAALAAQAALWAVFPFVAFRMAWESSSRWCQANAELRILLPDQPAGTRAKQR
ncbi:E3 ubiquitin-protein ligase MARCHF2-like [Ixodes scapularis]|uniref:E3 ubiquitin-protein ligase MARCHF2-like n=1 Tax=Ixodes scapularis TaxID=6945 RepID=UPI001C380B16|nr:E3 ubiquitin-protein ligase MARCHF2-like [Ixodes scapularis]